MRGGVWSSGRPPAARGAGGVRAAAVPADGAAGVGVGGGRPAAHRRLPPRRPQRCPETPPRPDPCPARLDRSLPGGRREQAAADGRVGGAARRACGRCASRGPAERGGQGRPGQQSFDYRREVGQDTPRVSRLARGRARLALVVPVFLGPGPGPAWEAVRVTVSLVTGPVARTGSDPLWPGGPSDAGIDPGSGSGPPAYGTGQPNDHPGR